LVGGTLPLLLKASLSPVLQFTSGQISLTPIYRRCDVFIFEIKAEYRVLAMNIKESGNYARTQACHVDQFFFVCFELEARFIDIYAGACWMNSFI
jgi:hypothetical protein